MSQVNNIIAVIAELASYVVFNLIVHYYVFFVCI